MGTQRDRLWKSSVTEMILRFLELITAHNGLKVICYKTVVDHEALPLLYMYTLEISCCVHQRPRDSRLGIET